MSKKQSQETQINNPLDPPKDEQGGGSEQPQRTYSKVTIGRMDDHVMGRIRGLIAKVNMEGPIEGIDDVSDFINKASERLITDLENKHNEGEKFPAPRRLPRGPKPSN